MKNSDRFSSLSAALQKAAKGTWMIAILLVASAFTAFAQEPYRFVEGSVHKFSVEYHDGNTYAWGMYIDPYTGIMMPSNTYDLMDGGQSNDLQIRFNDMDRSMAELVYLVVEETGTNGCSTKRALQIELQPNNMYLEFAMANSDDCYNYGQDYNAELRVGLNFLDKNANVPIPASRFPLQVEYTIRNETENGPVVVGNGGAPVQLDYNDQNAYALLVKEAVGTLNETTKYELTITSVKDKYETEITNNTGDIRLQIRVINHLPHGGGMEMAIAWLGEE